MADGFTFHVDRTAIMLFASAIGETNPIYYDDGYARSTPIGGVIAPPTFGTASSQWDPHYGLKGVRRIPAAPPRPPRRASQEGEGGGEGDAGGASLTRVLHGEQRYQYHQPLRPGMKLTVTTRPGETWTKEGRRGGRLRFSESVSEYRDEDGELVLTATSVGIVTEKAVEG